MNYRELIERASKALGLGIEFHDEPIEGNNQFPSNFEELIVTNCIAKTVYTVKPADFDAWVMTFTDGSKIYFQLARQPSDIEGKTMKG